MGIIKRGIINNRGFEKQGGGSGSGEWGAITGVLSNQTDLAAELANKISVLPQNPKEIHVNYQTGLPTNIGTITAPKDNLTSALINSSPSSAVDDTIIRVGNGGENGVTMYLNGKGLSLVGNADNTNVNSDLGLGLTYLNNCIVGVQNSVDINSFCLVNTEISTSGSVKFTNCNLKGVITLRGVGGTVAVFDKCNFSDANIIFINVGQTDNILKVFSNCIGQKISSLNPKWKVEERFATEEISGLMGFEEFTDLAFESTVITVVDTGFVQPEGLQGETDVDFSFSANNFTLFDYNFEVTVYSSQENNTITLPNYESSFSLSTKRDGKIVTILNNQDSTSSISVVTQNGRVVKTPSGNVLTYELPKSTSGTFRWHHSAITSNRYWILQN